MKSPNMKLTTTIARNLEPPTGKADHIEWDEDFPGFGVRLRVVIRPSRPSVRPLVGLTVGLFEKAAKSPMIMGTTRVCSPSAISLSLSPVL
jgi:hypothetical protein